MADEDRTPRPIEMRADKWRRPWILGGWPAMALCAPALLQSDNPNILVHRGDGLVTFKVENGKATYKIVDQTASPLVLELQPDSEFTEPPAPGTEPEPLPEPVKQPEVEVAVEAAEPLEHGGQYNGPEPGERVMHGDVERVVLNTQHRAGEGSFVQFDLEGEFVPVDGLRPVDD